MRTIFIVVLGYITGIIIGLYCKISIAFFYIGIFIVLAFMKNYIKPNIKRYSKLLVNKKVVCIFVIASIVSNSIVVYKNKSYENKYKKINEANFIAVIVSEPKQKQYYNQYKIKIETVDNNTKYKGDYLLLNLKQNMELSYGDRILFLGKFIMPEVQRNYKGFSYSTYLKSIGIYGCVEANSVKRLANQKGYFILKHIYSFRQNIKSVITKNIVDEDKRNLLLGILLGYDDELSDEVKEDFSNSGLSHILAVSGMHVSFVVMGIAVLLTKMRFSKRLSSIITIILLILFIFLTGEVPTVKRACITVILSLGASIVYRKSDTITNLSIALLIILLQNPFSILDTSLILSFLATIGIICFNYLVSFGNIKKSKNSKNMLLSNLYEHSKQIFQISISAQVFILPISIVVFNKITLTFLFSNLLISFIISSILILGFTSIVLQIKFIYIILNFLLGLILSIANFFASIPLSKVIITTPSIFFVVIYYCILILFIYIKILRKKEIKRRLEKRVLTFVDNFKQSIFKRSRKLLIVIIAIVITLQITYKSNPILKIYFIDVGQGDSCLIITPNKETILVDGGGSKNFDVGQKTLLPYLLDRKIKTIDYLIISHFDTDHVRTDFYIYYKK